MTYDLSVPTKAVVDPIKGHLDFINRVEEADFEEVGAALVDGGLTIGAEAEAAYDRLKGHLDFINGVEEADVEEVGAVLLTGGLTYAGVVSTYGAYKAIKAVNFVRDKLPDPKKFDEYRDKLKEIKKVVDESELTIKFAEALPTIGSFLKPFNLDGLLDVASKALDNVDGIFEKADQALIKLKTLDEKLGKILDTADTALKGTAAAMAVGTAYTAVLTARAVDDLFGDDDAAAEEPGDALAGWAKKIEAALEAYEIRYDAVAAPLIEFERQVSPAMEALEKALGSFEGPIDALVGGLGGIDKVFDALQNVLDKVQPLEDALAKFSTPFDKLFDFLENPPSIKIWVPQPIPWEPGFPGFNKTVSAFPAISRNDLGKVLDFIDGASGAVLALLSPILAPIEGALRPLIQPLLDALKPIQDLLGPVDDLLGLVEDLVELFKDAIADVGGAFEDFIKIIENIVSPPVLLEEIEAPADGETRVTFFGGDEAENVTGARSDNPDDGLSGAVLTGGGGDDTLTGTTAKDFLHGGADNDRLFGRGGADVLQGDDGDDKLVAGGGQDVADGGAGNDTVLGGAGSDRLMGGADDDRIKGAGGADEIVGGTGNDRLIGGKGADTFFFNVGDGQDTILGFSQGEDLIDIDGLSFDDLTIVTRKNATVLLYGEDDEIVLRGVTTPLTEDDFI